MTCNCEDVDYYPKFNNQLTILNKKLEAKRLELNSLQTEIKLIEEEILIYNKEKTNQNPKNIYASEKCVCKSVMIIQRIWRKYLKIKRKKIDHSMFSTTDDYINELKKEISIKRPSYDGVLKKENVLEWCHPDSVFSKNINSETEKKWGQWVINKNTNQFTTILGEMIVKDTLTLLDENPQRILKKGLGENSKKLVPDWETSNNLYECKARTYSTTGTAGEKILGTPWKYSECYMLYKKSLNIVCIAYQETEAEQDFCVFSPKTNVRKELLKYYEQKAGIKYIKLTDMLKMLYYKLKNE